MKAIHTTYFEINLLKRDARSLLVVLGSLLAAAGGVLVLQSFGYLSSIPDLLETGRLLWGQALGLMLQILAIWSVVLGAVFAIRYVTQPVMKYGADFWEAVVTGFPLGVVLPFLLVLGAGLIFYIPLGLLSLVAAEIFPYATLQFAWLAAAYLVFLWIVIGMMPVLAGTLRQAKWYYKFIAVLLFFQLGLDILQSLSTAVKLLARDSIWQTDQAAFLLAVLGSLLVTVLVVLLSLRGQPALVILYAIAGIYAASIATGNLSERLFGWGELPAAVAACLAPLVYVQAAKWILRQDGTAFPGLAAGYVGLLAGLLVDLLLQLRITGQGWASLLYGILFVLALGLLLFLLGRGLMKRLAGRFQLQTITVRVMDYGLVTGLVAGMLIGGFLAR